MPATVKWTPAQIKTLTDAYVKFDTPSDQIAQSLDLRRKFWAKLPRSITGTYTLDDTIKKLIALRKNGGLPAIRHK